MTDLPHTPPEPLPGPDQEAVIVAAVAARISDLRKSHGLSFDALAQRAGVSKGTLVQIEQGRANPSISTLCRLAAALEVSVADLVTPVEGPMHAVTVVGPSGACCLWNGPKGGSAVLLAGTPGPDMLEIWAWELMPSEFFDASGHGQGTREIVHVISGSLALEIGGQSAIVGASSSAIARTDQPHSYRNPGNTPVRFTMVVHEPPVSS